MVLSHFVASFSSVSFSLLSIIAKRQPFKMGRSGFLPRNCFRLAYMGEFIAYSVAKADLYFSAFLTDNLKEVSNDNICQT